MALDHFIYPRYPDWHARWAEFIHDCLQLASDLAIDWEYVNCFQFAGMGVEAITGHDPYDPLRPTITGPVSAAKTIKRMGYDNLDDLIEALFKEVPIAFAHPGDILLIEPTIWTGNEEEVEASKVMPHAVALADPPFYYTTGLTGLGRGDMYVEGLRAFAVGHEVNI